MPSMSTFDYYLFYIFFILSATVLFIVYLNFIIAEVTNSYQKVTLNLEVIILKQRIDMINES